MNGAKNWMILLNIRMLQAKRELNDSGAGLLVILGIISFLIYASYRVFLKTPDAYYLTAFLFLICAFLQSYRNDIAFVITHIRKPHIEIYSEYLLLTFPFAISSLFTEQWFCFPVLLVMLSVVPFISYTLVQKTYFSGISAILPASDFEWISGFRKSFLFLIPFYVLAIGFSWFRILPLLLLWFLTVSVASFYSECEPLHILKEGGFFAKEFLLRKLLRPTLYLLLLYTPVLLINTILNPEFWLLNLLFIPIQLSLLYYSVCLKYSTYEPNKKQLSNSIILSLVSLGSVIPYLLPIPLLLAVYTFGKAEKNLKEYLND